MRPRQRPGTGLLELARLQGHVISNEQLRGHGFSLRAVERLVGEGAWQRLDNGLLRTRPDPPDWTAWAWGGVLLGGERARLGETAAGHLWGLTAEPSEVTVFVPAHRTLTDRHQWRFVRESAGVRMPSRGNPPRTTVEDTVLDLCRNLNEREVIGVVLAAVQHQVTHPRRLARRLQERGRVRHRRLIESLLCDAIEGAESPLELRYLHDVERAHGLPTGERQSRVGRNVHDVRYREYATVVELDGRLGHEGLDRFRDMSRDNGALTRGEVTLRYGWGDVGGRCCRVAWQVGSVLMGRGWPGMPTRCRRCHHVPSADLVS